MNDEQLQRELIETVCEDSETTTGLIMQLLELCREHKCGPQAEKEIDEWLSEWYDPQDPQAMGWVDQFGRP